MPILGASSSSAKPAPTVPTSVSASNVGTSRAFNNGAATVSFTAPSTSKLPVTSYTVTSSPGSFTASGASSPLTVTGLQSNTAYTYTVTATSAAGTSSASSASASVTATTVPAAPTIGTATVSGTTASVPFTAGATGGSAVTVYTATSSPGGITGTSASTPISVTGLTGGTAYTFTVTATNANGTSTASAASNSVTPVGYWLASIYNSTYPTDGSGGSINYYETTAVDSSANSVTSGFVASGVSGKTAGFFIKKNSSGTLSLQKGIYGPGTGATNTVAAITTDSSGNIYATGEYVNASSRPNIGTYKWNSSGTLQWARAFAGPGTGSRENSGGYCISVDSSGNVYVGGRVRASGVTEGYQQGVLKYDSSGTLLWQSNYSGSQTQTNITYGISTDSSGNVYAASAAYQASRTLTAGHLIKYNSSGTLQWQKYIISGTGTASTFAGCITDTSGNTYAVGYTNNAAISENTGLIVKYDTSGTISWGRLLTTTVGSYFTGVTMDTSGYIYAVGYVINASTGATAFIAKWDSSGTLQWQRTLKRNYSDAGYNTKVTSISIESSTNSIFVHGSTYGSALDRYAFTAKLPTDGSKTGTYTIESGKQIVYAAGSFTEASAASYYVAATGALTSQTAGTDGAASLTEFTPAFSQTVVTI